MRHTPVRLFAVPIAGLVLAAGYLMGQPHHVTTAEDLLHGCTVVYAWHENYHPSVSVCSPL